MKKLFLTSILLIGSFSTVFSPQAVMAQKQREEEITQFNSVITINQDTSIDIEETLRYETSLEKHGIYRYIPLIYSQGGTRYRIDIDEVSVHDTQGNTLQYEQFKEEGNLVLKIGDPNSTFTGSKEYVINYSVDEAVRRFEEHDELYWDITGEGWQIPILRTHAIVYSDPATVTEVRCFSGRVGSDDGECLGTFEPHRADFSYNNTVDYGDNVTVAVKLSQENSQLVFPGVVEQTIDWIISNFFIVLLPLPTLVMAYLWFTRGRDEKFVSDNVFVSERGMETRKKGVFEKFRTPLVYEPLDGLSAGEAGALQDEKADNEDVVAEILELARQGYVKIESEEKKKLFKKETEYTLIKKKPADSSLSKAQQYLFDHLFESGDTVSLSELKGDFYTHFEKVKQLLFEQLQDKGMFVRSPRTVRGIYIALAILLHTAASIFVFVQAVPLGIFWPLIAEVPLVAISLLFAFNMPHKTAKGTNGMLQAKGLKETISLSKWRQEIKEKQLFIEEILPFAVSLGVVDQLAKDMDDLGIEPPQYFSGSSMRAMAFSDMSRSFVQSSTSNLSYNPSSSSSGGSGFSGGSSGGGGGGGGGGSW